MDVLPNEWRGEPLDSTMGRVSTRELIWRLPGSTVYTDNGAMSDAPDATVEVNVERFDLDRDGTVLLSAQVAIKGDYAARRHVDFAMPPADATTTDLVGAMIIATAQLADTIAAILADRRGARK